MALSLQEGRQRVKYRTQLVKPLVIKADHNKLKRITCSFNQIKNHKKCVLLIITSVSEELVPF